MVVALSTVEGKLSNTLLRFEGLIVSMTASALTLTAILILNFLYTRVAVWLTDKELHRWQCQQAFLCSGAKTHLCSSIVFSFVPGLPLSMIGFDASVYVEYPRNIAGPRLTMTTP